jgi:hypothetical protein
MSKTKSTFQFRLKTSTVNQTNHKIVKTIEKHDIKRKWYLLDSHFAKWWLEKLQNLSSSHDNHNGDHSRKFDTLKKQK